MIFWIVLGVLLFFEIIYHLVCFGMTAINPLITLGLCACAAGAEGFVIGLFRKKGKAIALGTFIGLHIIAYGAQMVYWKVFKQPLLFAAVVNAGGDALTDYWKEILDTMAILWLPLICMVLLLVLAGILYAKRRKNPRERRRYQQMKCVVGCFAGLLIFCNGLLVETQLPKLTGRMYWEFYDAAAVFEEYGVFAGMQRDLHNMIFGKNSADSFLELDDESVSEEMHASEEKTVSDSETEVPSETETSPTEETTRPEEKLPHAQVLPIDFQKLADEETDEQIKKLHQYVQNRVPTYTNEYTGMFEGYNLIYLTAEGFAPYCIDEKLTPTLYKLTNSGFRFENFYVPLWCTSTSDGEFMNCTGLVPEGQFSMKRSADNAMPFALPGFWQTENVQSRAYHNNTLSYYERYRTHENLGYFFKASLLGDLPEEEWKDHLYEIATPKAWPQSDLEMMQATVGEYVNEPRFNVYYMTVSGHLKYTFSGNRMSGKNKEAVADLPYSDEAKAYIACNIELDKALEYLIAELEKAGQLEKTVICMAADHYPYGLEDTVVEELRGTPLEKKYDRYHSSLILWNSEMEPVTVEKRCSSVDILPTLLNLFGFEYDSRLYTGQDILSDSSPLLIFLDRSFMTDKVYYDARKKETESFDGTEVDPEYIKKMRKQVNNAIAFTGGVLNFNYYSTLQEYAPKGEDNE